MHYFATLKNRTQFDYLGQKYFVLNYGTQILMFTLADYCICNAVHTSFIFLKKFRLRILYKTGNAYASNECL